MEKRLKKIELDDIQEVSSMLRAFWKTQLVDAPDSDILEDLGRMLNPKCIAFLIMSDSDVAGFIFVNEKYGYINNIEYLFVKKEHRGKGLATFALQEIKRIILTKKNPRVQIEVSPNNVKALSLYQSVGFDHIDTLTLATTLPGETEEIEVNGITFKTNTKKSFRKG